MAQAPRPGGKNRKIFYEVMKTPKELRQTDKKPSKRKVRGWAADYMIPQ